MKLAEGEVHEFQVIKTVTLLEEGNFFVLRHKSGRRITLSTHIYQHYGIRVGQSLSCRVDKVSCTGKVFLEPEHPVYKEGKEYEFEVLDCFQEKENTNDEHFILVVADCFQNRINVVVSEKIERKTCSRVFLLVVEVNKGVPMLVHPKFQ